MTQLGVCPPPPNLTYIQHSIPGMANLVSKLGQIGPKWNKSGTFKDEFSVASLVIPERTYHFDGNFYSSIVSPNLKGMNELAEEFSFTS